MSPQEYKLAKARSGITVVDIWCGAMRISPDQDKAYSSGRTPVAPEVAFRITNLVQQLEDGAVELQRTLQQALPMCSIKLNDENLTIEITFPKGKSVQLQNRGVDLLNFWPVFKANSSPKDAALFLRTPVPAWQKKDNPNKWSWYLWRGDFLENRNLGHFQSHWNTPTERLLLEAFKNYV